MSLVNEKVYALRKRLLKKQEVTENMFAELTPNEMMILAKMLTNENDLYNIRMELNK